MYPSLFEKYNVPGPRYTSYPTVPYWDVENFSEVGWKSALLKTFNATNQKDGIGLYIHLPFCESLCTFCGCNKRITKNHQVEGPYIDAVLKEWKMYTRMLPVKPHLREIHLGGGSPTFFAANQLKRLMEGIVAEAIVRPDRQFSFEGNPQNTTREQLEVLYAYGFKRVSFGIQDFDPLVQKTINRVQTYLQVAEVTRLSREIGFTSVNYDVVYGLPFQTVDSIRDTFDKIGQLRPDRIAFYSYAHVPWVKGVGQRKFTEEDLPQGPEKRVLYETGRTLLEAQGYEEVGMDHFALPADPLYIALQQGKLHRNFMGYTEANARLQIGLGVSSISDSWTAFAQNVKTLEEYENHLANDQLPLLKGHLLTSLDVQIRQMILDLMCQRDARWELTRSSNTGVFREVRRRLKELEHDGFLRLFPHGVAITPEGKPFLRNICMAFDVRLWDKLPETQLFSMTV